MRYLLLVLAALLIGGCNADIQRTDDPGGLPESTVPVVELGDSDTMDVGEDGGVLLPTNRGSLDATPTPMPVRSVPAPEPEPTDAPEPAPPSSSPSLEPAAGTLVYNVPLTVYTCYGGSETHCPWGQAMYCPPHKPVYRGAAACGWRWDCGQQFRIVGDPAGTVYTCEDRGGLVVGIDAWFMCYEKEDDPVCTAVEAGKSWRAEIGAIYDGSHLVTIELLN